MIKTTILHNLLEVAFEQVENTSTFPPEDQVNRCIRISSGFMFSFYGFLLLVATYNTIRFVFGSSRYQNFHITYFYILVYLVVFLRLAWLSMMLYVVNNSSDYTTIN